MKKKILGLCFAFVLLVPCVLLLTACGGNDAKLSNLYVVDGNGDSYTSYYAGEYNYGVSLSDILAGIKIKGTYSDNTSKELSSNDYTTVYKKDSNNIDAIKPTPDAGNYQIIYEKEGWSVDINFDVYKARYYNVTLTSSSWDYDDALPTISLSNYVLGQDESVDYYYIEKGDYDSLNDYQKTDFLGSGYEKKWTRELYSIKPGQYYAFANINFSSENENYLSLTNVFPFTVNKAQINVTKEDIQGLSASYSYYAHERIGDITLDLLMKEGFTNKIIKNKRGDDVEGYFEWKKPNTPVNASNNGELYPIVFMSEGENFGCYESNEMYLQITIEKDIVGNKNSMQIVFEDNKMNEIVFDNQEHNIKLNEFPISYQEGDMGMVFPSVELKDANGNDVTIKWHDSGEGLGYYYISGLKEVGEYKFILSLTDTTNFCWNDGTTEPIEYIVKIVSDGNILNVFGEYEPVNPETDGASSPQPAYMEYLGRWMEIEMETTASDYNAQIQIDYKDQNQTLKITGNLNNKYNDEATNDEPTYNDFITNTTLTHGKDNYVINGKVDTSGLNNDYTVTRNGEETNFVIDANLHSLIMLALRIDLANNLISDETATYSVAQDSENLKIKVENNFDGDVAVVHFVFDAEGNFVGHKISITSVDGTYSIQMKLVK